MVKIYCDGCEKELATPHFFSLTHQGRLILEGHLCSMCRDKLGKVFERKEWKAKEIE